MANALTGEFDVVAEVSVDAVNRILAAQHQVQHPREIYLHSFWVRIPPRGEDERTWGVRGTAEVQVSTPTITLPTDGSSSRVTIHTQVMAHVNAMKLGLGPPVGIIPPHAPEPTFPTPLPEFIHGEVQVTVDIGRISSAMDDLIVIDFDADDVEVTFTPAPGSPDLGGAERVH